MFGVNKAKKDTSNSVENNCANTYEIQVENEKLKIQVETLQFKLDQANEKYSVVNDQLFDLKKTDIEKIKNENESLKKELADLKFKIENDTKSIELETENKKLKSQVVIQQSENKYLKEVLDAYRSMPDVKNMIDNISSLAVPHIDELKEFAKMLSDSKIFTLCDNMSKVYEALKQMQDDYRYSRNTRY